MSEKEREREREREIPAVLNLHTQREFPAPLMRSADGQRATVDRQRSTANGQRSTANGQRATAITFRLRFSAIVSVAFNQKAIVLMLMVFSNNIFLETGPAGLVILPVSSYSITALTFYGRHFLLLQSNVTSVFSISILRNTYTYLYLYLFLRNIDLTISTCY